MARESARFGYYQPSGQIGRFHFNAKSPDYTDLDKFHPLHMIASTVLMAERNSDIYPKKKEAIRYFEESDSLRTEVELNILAYYPYDYRRAENFPLPDDFLKQSIFLDRPSESLDVYVPDEEFYTALVAEGLREKDIIRMTTRVDAGRLVALYGHIFNKEGVDLASVLLHPQEKWLTEGETQFVK
ncbi:MAG TPA: hypothetical protein VG965_04220 [Patescibacteria group bacterium]|nr:hypothetical protein [Patescibacteria group bacterium]